MDNQINTMKPKQRLELILSGQTPDVPPHWEMVMDFVVQLYEHPETMHQRAREKCDKAKQFSRD
jgi:hypothetical protein